MNTFRLPLSFALLSMLAVGPALADVSGSPLVDHVRAANDRFKDVAVAVAEGYGPIPCASGPQGGAMGIHYVNGDLVGDGKLDASRPEALMYEPKGGKLELVGVEYIVIAAAWDAANKTPPTLMGQLFHYNSSPNRYGIPAYYALHVWAWRHNPHGVLVDWNPKVSCDGYSTGAAPRSAADVRK